MPGIFGHKTGDAENRRLKWKSIDTDPVTGETVWAPLLALEPASVGGGGGLTDAELRATPVPVSGTFFQATQPVSGTFWQATQPVSGTFWQATQPVSGPLTDAQLRAAVVPISDGGGSLTVDGTFWQATQPVSGPLTDAQLRAVAVPVSGTFWQATQPVSGTFWPTAAASPASHRLSDGTSFYNALTDTQLRATPVPVSGTVAATLSEPISIDDNAGSITVSGTFWQATQPVSGTFWQATQPVSGTFWQATQPVSLATNTPDVTDRAAREVGRVRIWDGTDEATLLPNRTQPATTEKSLHTVVLPYRQPTYATTTIAIAPAITIGVKEMLAIWHAAADAKDMYIIEISVAGLVTTASTAGRSAVRVSTITTAPTGGTEEAKVDISGAGVSGMTNTMRVKTGGGAIGSTFIRKAVWGATQAVNSRVSEVLFKAEDPRSAIILRGGVAAGISIDLEREVAHTAIVDQWYVTVRWLEL